jgi:hypothetical protein
MPKIDKKGEQTESKRRAKGEQKESKRRAKGEQKESKRSKLLLLLSYHSIT